MTTPSRNSLSQASSAYLRSAMHQPIRWNQWGDEAFATAQRENKPILLDIGAVWCHWCHVMDRESYDDPEVAKIVNEHFVAVKVDRDERPDIDSRYQVAVSAVSGQGGWPLTAFLTPDGKPFYGGTYFPPEDSYGRPSFKRVLSSIAEAYHQKNGDVIDQAKMVESAISQAESFSGSSGEFSPKVIDGIVESALKMFDPQNGGFGNAPKFPHPAVLDLVIDQYARSGDDKLRAIFVPTLERMARGGVYDQLAGGFHRYSVDERWIVPHFEKMCYDNSELLKNYIHAYQVTGSEFFAAVARDIVRWMDAWLSDRERGGFYASQDADYSMDDDGDYFTWTRAEMQAVLTQAEAAVAGLHYDVNEIGEMHHNPEKNVLYVRAPVEEVSKRMGLTAEHTQALLESAKEKMYAARRQRPTPYIDKTMYAGWNALCVSAYLEAARVLKLDSARQFALRSLDRILAGAWQPEVGLRHVVAYSEQAHSDPAYSDPAGDRRAVPGMLDDYAFTAVACLDAYEATADLSYFTFAQRIADKMLDRMFDPVSGGFFDTASPVDGEQKPMGVLGTRRKPFQDSPTPAGNPVAAIALLRLHTYTGQQRYREKAEQTLELLAGLAGKFGIFAATYGIAAVHFSQPHTRIVIVGDDDVAQQLYAIAASFFGLDNSILKLPANEAVAQNLPPSLAETIPHLTGATKGKSAAVLCYGVSCQPPIFDPEQLRQSLARGLKAAS
jgi:uncharacterized protein YyaL (SSP411 family)